MIQTGAYILLLLIKHFDLYVMRGLDNIKITEHPGTPLEVHCTKCMLIAYNSDSVEKLGLGELIL
jgi:hypothetical protein